MSLLDVQGAFQAYVLHDRQGDLATRVSGDPGEAQRRLGVYHHAYRARTAALLREVFDKTWSWLGDDRFEAAAAAYVSGHTSTSARLDDYGAGFPEFLARRWPAEPDVAELAWLDGAMRRVFDGPDAAPVRPERIAALSPDDWDRARLILHPTLTVRTVTTNVGALWAGLDAGSPVLPAALDGPMALRVWRKGLQPHFRTIPDGEEAALVRLGRGETFAAVCEDLARDGDDAPLRAAALLAGWLEDALVVGIEL